MSVFLEEPLGGNRYIINKGGNVKKHFFSLGVMMAVAALFAATQEERIEELERIARYIPDDWIDENNPEVIPSPADAKKKFNLTDAELFNDIMTLANKYTIIETNEENRICKKSAVEWIGTYGTTNSIPYLRTIMYNRADYTQSEALFSVLRLSIKSESIISPAYDAVTNKTVFSEALRRSVYVFLHTKCTRGISSNYEDNPLLHSRIASFFLERAALESDMTLYVDRVACDLNPSYRHSQQRRDNLARLRNPGLTGLPAQLYDAAQHDAQPKE